ncbi:unnamed protein product [Bursaphelenchus xylophilus]|uniref:(pine wood nematode) hypothetical protein n=1 Tax=Bursaphelenchus xylophilus TaxID=6326 RepID=A0A1I7S739_BURXY|nr:unnamed protein product [Bursaphelenchus xylophilus]CAG9084576.1 unnamed protein product [Bursaphelenchus xylophilus]
MNLYIKKYPKNIKSGLLCPSKQCIILNYPLAILNYSSDSVLEIAEKNELADPVLTLNRDDQLLLLSGPSHRVVDIDSGKKLRDIYEHDGIIKAACWSPTSSNVFATAGTDSTVRTWDVRQHPAQTMAIRLKRYSCIQFSPDGRFLCFGGDNNINLMDLQNPRNLTTINSPSAVSEVKFNPVEYILASINTDKVVRFWDIDAKECIAQTLPLDIEPQTIEFSSCGKYLVSVSQNQINSFSFEPFDVIEQLNLNSPAHRVLLDFKICDDKMYYLSYDSKRREVAVESFQETEFNKDEALPALSPIPKDSGLNGHITDEGADIIKETNAITGFRNILSRSSSMSSARNLPLNRSRENSHSSLIDRKSSIDLSSMPDCSETIKEHNARIKKGSVTGKTNKSAEIVKRIELHSVTMDKLKARMQDCRRIQCLSRISSIEDTLQEAAKMPGAHMLVAVINAYRSQSPTLQLGFYAKVLIYVKQLLSHNNWDYVNLGMDLINGVLTDYGDVIKDTLTLSLTPSADDERIRHYIACKRALTEIYILAPTLSGRLNQHQNQVFSTLLPILKALVE